MFKIELSTPNPPVKINWDDYQYSDLKKSYSSQPYSVDFNLTYYSTPTFKLFFDFLFNSLQSISLSDDEVKVYKESGEPMYELSTFDNGQLHISHDGYIGGNGQTYYFRNDIVETIISSISVSFRNALLPHWQIVRSSTDKGDESITFKNYRHSWQSYPKNRFVKWSNHPLVTRASNTWIQFGFLPNMMSGDETQLATFNIKIGFTEDELINTTGFEIKKLEDIDVNNIQSSNEIWCTFPSYSKLDRDAKARCTYNAKNRCWILHYDRELTEIYNYYSYSWFRLTSITIPNSVTWIEGGTFSGCTGLTSITISNSVTSIEGGTFEGCTGLTSITIPNSVTSIGNGAFEGCTGLTSITIPNSVTHIKEYAFKGCTGLTSITIPNSVTHIEEYAFSGCTGLTSITIPNSDTWIGSDAFRGTSQECIAYLPIGRPEYYKNMLSRSGFKGSVVEISETDSLSQ